MNVSMTCSIPGEIEQQLAVRAAQRQTSVDHLVREALQWYLQVGEETLDELAAWQEVRDEAADLIEDSSP